LTTLVSVEQKGVEVEQARKAPSPRNAEMRIEDALLEAFLKTHDVEVPQNLVDDEVRMMVLELNHRLRYESLASGRYTGFTQAEIASRMEEFREEAFKLVKTRLVLKRIIEAEHLEVTQEELEEEARAISIRQQMPIEVVRDFFGEDLGPLKDDLLVRKAIDSINANA